MITGNAGQTPINLICTAVLVESVMSAEYQFTWMKDGNSIDQSDSRINV